MQKDMDKKWEAVIEYLPLIECMAKSYSHMFIPYDDLFQEACFVVYDNISSYNSDLGKTLYSFLATRIRYRYLDLFNIGNFGFTVSLPSSRRAFKLRRLQEKVENSTGGSLSIEEIKEQLDFSEKTITSLEELNHRMALSKILPLPDFSVSDEADDSDFIENDGQVVEFISSLVEEINVEDEVIQKILLEDLENVFNQVLTKQQMLAILYRLGFVTGEVLTFTKVASIIGGTRQNAQQCYKDGIKCLQKYFS